MTDKQYRQLRAAVEAYDKALRAYGVMADPNNRWLETDQLDRLWAAVLRAADIDSPVRDDTETDS